MKRYRYRISFQLAVMVVICCSILLLSVTLIYQGFREVHAEIISATQMTAKYVSSSINQRIISTLTPAKTTLDLISRTRLTTARTFEERAKSLPLLRAILDANPISAAVYVGYDTGEFFLLRTLDDEPYLPAPPASHYLLQSITQGVDGKFIGEFSFYDKDLALLERRTMPDYHYDPRQRDWFKAGKATSDVSITPPHTFFSSQDVGVSLSRKSLNGDAVVSMDVSINDLNDFLHTLRITPDTEVVIVDRKMRAIAYPDTGRLIVKGTNNYRLSRLDELKVPILKHLGAMTFPNDTIMPVQSDTSHYWYGIASPLPVFTRSDLRILIAIPSDELMEGVWHGLVKQGIVSSLIVIVVLLSGWYLGRQIVAPLHKLTNQVKCLSEFNFSTPIGVSTPLKEVQELGDVLAQMADTINGFQKISRTLNKERNLERMLKAVLAQLLGIVRLRDGVIYLYDNTTNTLRMSAYRGRNVSGEIALPSLGMSDQELVAYIQSQSGPDDIVTVLRNREHELIGVLNIMYNATSGDAKPEVFARFIRRIAGSAAVAIETRQMVLTQKALLDGMIQLVADAIDAKSQYTGGHCRRVPELAIMMMENIRNFPTTPFVGFSMTKAQQEEFRVAAWLHDCGKITTPEYVIDKATKLETIYNRIHEIRTRFEVLHRDATIACLENIAEGMDPEQARAACRAEQAILQEEFAFIAQSNIGSETMAPEDIGRIQQIARKTWLRHFDNRLGLSRDERQRFDAANEDESLPAVEHLLADKSSHVIPWNGRIPPVQADDPRNIWGFDMTPPQNMYDYGEIYNLSIRHGTLCSEERFKIDEHIVQTICMLSRLPFPKLFSRVPDIAGNHHERMDGKGYPRRIDGTTMSIPEKIMAVADIFEALTAPDRPYKEGKTLSQALSILSKMAQNRHVDCDVFNMLLLSGVYMEYAMQYMDPAQIDEVSIDAYLVVPSAGAASSAIWSHADTPECE